MEDSKIEWTNHTFNPWWGCMKVSAGCKNCYAETLDNRWNKDEPHWGPNSFRKPMSDAYWLQPFKWNEEAARSGVKAKVFCASMADVFEDNIQVIDWRRRLFNVIENTPNLIWQLLTKRPENILRMVPPHWNHYSWPQNVWMGTSVENQEMADERIAILLCVPSKVRFLSCEPLLGNIQFNNVLGLCYNGESELSSNFRAFKGIHWVICGGESGNSSRPIYTGWVENIRDQCVAAKVPFFFKQWGEWTSFDNLSTDIQKEITSDKIKPHKVTFEEMHVEDTLYKIGKNNAGAFLYGKEYKEFPNV